VTISQEDTAFSSPTSNVAPTGSPLAGAIAVFLGGYLLLLAFTGTRLGTVAANAAWFMVDGPEIELGVNEAQLTFAQFLFALAVVVVGLFFSGGSLTRRVIGAAVVVVAALSTLVFIGVLISGAFPLPGREAGTAIQAVFANPWFSVVLSVGFAWLLIRRVSIGWIALLGAVVLLVLPTMFTFNSVESATRSLVLFAVSAIVGAVIIGVGRPLRP
jgi:hypothetical protein